VMLISLRNLKLQKNLIEFKEEFPADTFELGPDVRQASQLESTWRAMLVEEHDEHRRKLDDIRVVGSLKTDLEILCARCLEPVHYPIQREFDLLYRPAGSDITEDKEVEIQDTDAAISYYEGDGVQTVDLLREQVLLEVPLKTLCKEDCKGLCPHCGINLNTGKCECAQAATDPRWEALKGLKDKLQK
jgi:uncharacterized protein